MRRCERCGRNYYYDSCPYCELTSEDQPGKKGGAMGGRGYFWIVIIILGFIAAILDPPSIIPVMGIAGVIWAISRIGAQRLGKKHRK